MEEPPRSRRTSSPRRWGCKRVLAPAGWGLSIRPVVPMIVDMRQGLALVRGALVATALLAVPATADAVTVPGESVNAGPVHVQTPPVTVNPPSTNTPVDPVAGGGNNTANHITNQLPTGVSVPGSNGSPVSIS